METEVQQLTCKQISLKKIEKEQEAKTNLFISTGECNLKNIVRKIKILLEILRIRTN